MARKLPQLQRALDAPALASVAYGEVASSLYFALGIVALHALGLTPMVLAVVGVLFLVVTLSYAEGTTTIGETGGAATFVRVAFNDLAGFMTGWVGRRSLHSPETVLAAATISIVLLVSTEFTSNPVSFLASLFSFGVLVAFTAAQLAVVKLRFSKPDAERPFRVPLSIRVRGADVPLPTVIGALATTAIFVAAMATHIGARYGGPIWLAAGIVVSLP